MPARVHPHPCRVALPVWPPPAGARPGARLAVSHANACRRLSPSACCCVHTLHGQPRNRTVQCPHFHRRPPRLQVQLRWLHLPRILLHCRTRSLDPALPVRACLRLCSWLVHSSISPDPNPCSGCPPAAAAASTSTQSTTPAARRVPSAAAPATRSTGARAHACLWLADASACCWLVVFKRCCNWVVGPRKALRHRIPVTGCLTHHFPPASLQPVCVQLRPRLGGPQASGSDSGPKQQQQPAGGSGGGRAGRHAGGAARRQRQRLSRTKPSQPAVYLSQQMLPCPQCKWANTLGHHAAVIGNRKPLCIPLIVHEFTWT